MFLGMFEIAISQALLVTGVNTVAIFEEEFTFGSFVFHQPGVSVPGDCPRPRVQQSVTPSGGVGRQLMTCSVMNWSHRYP